MFVVGAVQVESSAALADWIQKRLVKFASCSFQFSRRLKFRYYYLG